jgi:transaldolase/glucose-6-phosphate isomerase
MTKNTLQQLHDQGQSPWIDFITRELVTSGDLQSQVEQGIMGLTSNPTIFQKAISGSASYDDDVRALMREDKSVSEIYDKIVLDDIRGAANVMRQVYDRTDGRDGFVSIEVAPNLAYETEKSFSEACRIFDFLNLPNVMIKIPGTPEGIPAFQRAIARGINVNVTLVFSLENYRNVAEAYIAGLEERAASGQPVDHLSSVASFFVSRVDTMVDKMLDDMIAADAQRKSQLESLQGKAAIANAKQAYHAYQEIFAGPRWQKLADQGARAQRCLWASTSTKNPKYRDILYAEQLIGPDTVDTMPPQTIEAFLDHAVVERTLDKDFDQARAELGALESAGISMAQVTHQLQVNGVKLFSDSFDELINAISEKRAQMMVAVK